MPNRNRNIYIASSKMVIKILRKGGELQTYLKVIALILFIIPFLTMSTPIASASPQNSHQYKFIGIIYDPVSFKKIGDAKVNLKHAGQILYVDVILNDVKYTATIPTSKLLVFSNNSARWWERCGIGISLSFGYRK